MTDLFWGEKQSQIHSMCTFVAGVIIFYCSETLVMQGSSHAQRELELFVKQNGQNLICVNIRAMENENPKYVW